MREIELMFKLERIKDLCNELILDCHKLQIEKATGKKVEIRIIK